MYVEYRKKRAQEYGCTGAFSIGEVGPESSAVMARDGIRGTTRTLHSLFSCILF